MEQNPSWVANTFSDNQEISRTIWHPEVYYCIHKSPLICPELHPDQSISCFPSHLLKFYFNTTLPSKLISSKWPHFLKFSHQNPICHSPLPHTCYMSRPYILLYSITRIVFGAEQRSLSSSLYGILHPPVTISLFGQNILHSTLLSDTLGLCSSLNVTDQDSHPYKTTGNITVLSISISVFLDSKPEDKRSCSKW